MAGSDSGLATFSNQEDTTPGENGTSDYSLCSVCIKLDFSIQKFIISGTQLSRDGPDGALSTGYGSSSSVNVLQAGPNRHGGFRLNSGNARQAFATYSQVRRRHKTCRFCNLTFLAIERYSKGRVEPDAKLWLSWEVDGRQTVDLSGDKDAYKSKSMINRTRRIRLAWREKHDKEEAVYIVFVAPSGARRVNSDANVDAARSTHFLGRGLSSSKEKQALIRSWVDLCVKKHGPACCRSSNGDRDNFIKLINGTFFGVIDVIDMQLKALPIINDTPSRYIALSYVWGKKKPGGSNPYMTTRSNVMLHIQHGGVEKVWHRLPRTIQDAILLVSRLGERYIWIDSLCIVQDSQSSWELNAKNMHLVYGNAHFTICAADGDADTSLAAIEPILSQKANIGGSQEGYRAPSDGGVGELPTTAEETHLPPLTEEILPGIRLLVSRSAETVIQNSHWNQRGWTFQERLLSHRCLIFAEGQVYFQCRSAVMTQNIFTDGSANGWSLDWTNSPLRTLGELRRRTFWFYMKCVSLYTGRQLSRSKDVLTAFGGVSWLLEEHMKAPLFYGLPMSHFDLALLWTPTESLDRRGTSYDKTSHGDDSSSGSGCCTEELGNCSCHNKDEEHGAQDFPSWSWAGWQGGKSEYHLDMIDGSLVHVRDWLKKHTWILWHVRDYEGNLRPLWDKNILSEDRSEECRWRGYKGKPPPRFRPRRRGSESSEEETVMELRQRKLEAYKRRSNEEYLARLPEIENYAGNEDEREGLGKRSKRSSVAPTAEPEPSSGSPSPAVVSHEQQPYLPTPYPSLQPYGQPVLPYGQSIYAFGQPPQPYEHLPPAYPQPRQPYGNPSDSQTYQLYPPPGPYTTHGFPPPPGQSYGQQLPQPYRAAEPPPPPTEVKGGKNKSSEKPSDRGRYRKSGGKDDASTRDSHGQDDTGSGVESPSYQYATRFSRSRSSSGSRSSSSHDTTITLPIRPNAGLEDAFGRPIRDEIKGRNRTEFTGILPDNPFGIITGPFPEKRKDHGHAMPILQFWTWRTELFATIRRENATSSLPSSDLSTDSPAPDQPPGTSAESLSPKVLVRCDISDKAGDWCGTIMLPLSWIGAPKLEGNTPLLFIALSDAKAFTSDECPVWNYYIPKERDESEWDLYYVMLLQRNKKRALWERVAVGKVFQAAFGTAVWDEIKLG